MKKKKDNFVSESEFTVSKTGAPENIPPTGPMKGNPVHYGKERAVPPGKLQKKDIREIKKEAKRR